MSQFSAASLDKLASSALTPEYLLEAGARPVLVAEDLPPEFADQAGICPVPGMLIPWRSPRDPDRVVWQYRPDTPVSEKLKYVFPTGAHQKIGMIRPAATENYQVVVVEGTLQSLAFARYAPDNVAVYAIPGCWGWSKDKSPTPELAMTKDRQVVIFLDADASTNYLVYTGGTEMVRGAVTYGALEPVMFGRIPMRGSNGIDDFLATVDEDERTNTVARLLSASMLSLKPADRKPPAPKSSASLGLATSAGLPDPNDTLLGTTWGDTNRDVFRWLTDQESWLRYRDGRWDPTGATVTGASMLRFLDGIAGQYMAAAASMDGEKQEKLEETGRGLLASAKRQSVLSAASCYDELHLTRDLVDQHPTLWCAANCVIDLETGEVRDHDPNLLLTSGSDVAYDPNAECPRFDQFLAEVLPDPDTRDFTMQLFGMAMLGEVRDHVIPTLIGEGRNGKGTQLKIMAAVFGSQAITINPKSLLKRKNEEHTQEIAKLAGKRLAVAEETGQGAAWDVAKVNQWTGNNTLSGRFMRGNDFDFEPSHTLILVTNHRPTVGQGERAFWARYREVPFTVSFEGREDTGLSNYIVRNELPGVLNRMLEALARYRGAGRLVAPAAVEIASAAAKVDSDHLARFVAEFIVVTHDHETDRVLNTELYDRVAKWWSQHVTGEVPPSDRVFPRQMRQALGFSATDNNPRKLGQGRDVRRTWTGIRWLDEGHFQGQLVPLSDDHGLSAVIGSAGCTEENSGAIAEDDLPPWDIGSADTTADKSADVVDHESIVSPAEDSVSAVTDDTDDKLQYPPQDGGEESKQCYNTPSHISSPASQLIMGAHRQHRQIGSVEPAPFDDSVKIDSGFVTFDLETGSSDRLYDAEDPAGYVRIAGITTEHGSGVWTGPDHLLATLRDATFIVGTNIVHFDLPALQRVPDSGVDVLELTEQYRVLDTMIVDSVLNPIVNDKRPGEVPRAMKRFALDASCERYGIPGKVNDAKALAKKHDGFDRIPVEDAEYREYCLGDTIATTRLIGKLREMISAAPPALRAYMFREHRVHAIAAQMGMSGFTVDQPLLEQRYRAGVERKAELTAQMVARYDIPTTNAQGKPAKSPGTTKEGKAALVRAFASLGIAEEQLPHTPKGQISFGGTQMRELAETYATHPAAEQINALCDVIADSAGIRTVYGTVLEHLKADGKVHPQVATFQASGRWSVTKPGLTVFGKRGIGANGERRVLERRVFRAAPGHVLMAIDLSQIDARAIAVHSQDHGYMNLFGVDPDTGKQLDAHELVGRMVWGDAVYDSNPKAYREQIKGITHGLPYGMGTAKLAAHAKVSVEVAQHVVDLMNAEFPRLQQWKEETRERATAGQWLDNGFGRLMRARPEDAHTQGPALVGQGTARDLMMQCLINVANLEDKRIIKMLRVQIHDEAIWELPEADARDLSQEIERCFNFVWAPASMPDARPIHVMADAGPLGVSWDECYP